MMKWDVRGCLESNLWLSVDKTMKIFIINKKYILELLVNIVTAVIEVISGNKAFVPVSKKSATCQLSHVLYCETLRKLNKVGHSVQKAWNADIRCSAPP
jgi:hypothetical protein